MAAIGQHERQRPQIEEVAAKLYLLRFAVFRTFRDQIDWIGVEGARKALKCPLTVDMFDRDARPMFVDSMLTAIVNQSQSAIEKPPAKRLSSTDPRSTASRDRSKGRLKPTIRPRPS